MDVGLRVVRGQDWKWHNQDSGEGHVGTVVEIGKPGSTTSPDKTVVVQWDSGSRTNYRVGYQGSYDLRVIDNAPVGVKHPNIICDGCRKQGIQGMRWKCTKCYDFDLCSECYMDNKHDLSHSFLRFENSSSSGVKVPKRTGSSSLQMRGIFAGAKVVRGPDWDWGNQDGGEGKTGKVLDIRGWDNESHRSVANVTWTSGATNVYRMGHKGKVDLKYITDAPGGNYYPTHLPTLGKNIGSELGEKQTAASKVPCHFKIGDKVRVDLDPEILKVMQEGHGGWNPRMAEYVGKIGTVHRITERGDVRVQYEGCTNRWTFHAGALTKIHQFAVGDTVQIIEHVQHVKDLQKGHGEWTENMKNALGKNGRVQKVYADGDLRVCVDGQTWTFNPACCLTASHTQPDFNNTMREDHRQEPTNTLEALLELLQMQVPSSTDPDKLVREAAQGHLDVVRDILNKCPEKANQKSSGKTALQVASHQGHIEIVKLLIKVGADLEAQDEDGDTALHYSAFGNQPEICEFLLSNGASINAINKGGCSTLHVAVNKQQVKCVKALLSHKSDVNIQDAYGDTALHDAIGKDSLEILEMLITYPGVDFTLKNKRGFNVLHHAALKGNNYATEKILSKARQAVDVKKDDGFGALHLAALNGHKEVANTLITLGKADVEMRNNRQQTPLLLAVSQGHIPLILLLVSVGGADVNAEDEDGDSCLHLALMRRSVALDPDTSPHLAPIRVQLGMVNADDASKMGAAIACYLAQQGADIYRRNLQGKTPLSMVSDPMVAEILRAYASSGSLSSNNTQRADGGNPDIEAENPATYCMVCEEEIASITFEPCGHQIACNECGTKMKKCLTCMQPITKKLTADGTEIKVAKDKVSATAIRELERKMQEMEDTYNCSICLENVKTVVFLCGHSACAQCAQPLKVCHMCRKPITRKINIFT